MTTDKNSPAYRLGRLIGALITIAVVGLILWGLVLIFQGLAGAVGF